jgi:hypothetical protein
VSEIGEGMMDGGAYTANIPIQFNIQNIMKPACPNLNRGEVSGNTYGEVGVRTCG